MSDNKFVFDTKLSQFVPDSKRGNRVVSGVGSGSAGGRSGGTNGIGGAEIKTIEQYPYNNYPYNVSFTLDNGTQQVTISPQAIVYFTIDDSLSKWYASGELVTEFNFDTLENASLLNGGSKYTFRNDGFDFLKVSIKPVDPEKAHKKGPDAFRFQNLPQHMLHLNYWFSIYDIQDLENPNVEDSLKNISKYKKFYFWDYRYQKMSTNIIEYSTALSPKCAGADSTAPDSARSLATGEILQEIIKLTDIDEPLKKTAADLGKNNEWDKGFGALFLTANTDQTIADLVDYVVERHVAEQGVTYDTGHAGMGVAAAAPMPAQAVAAAGAPAGAAAGAATGAGATTAPAAGSPAPTGGGASVDGISPAALQYALRVSAAESGAGAHSAKAVTREIADVKNTIAMSQGYANGMDPRGVSFSRVNQIADTLIAQGKVTPAKLDVGYTQHNERDNKAYGLVNSGSYKEQVLSVARHVQKQAAKNPNFNAAISRGDYATAERMNVVPGWNTSIYKDSHMSNKAAMSSRIASQYGGDPFKALDGLNEIYPPTEPIDKMLGPGYKPPTGAGGALPGVPGLGSPAAGGYPGAGGVAAPPLPPMSTSNLPGAAKIHDVCIFSTSRGPTENDYGYFTLRPLNDYFKNAGKSSPGELQLEHFYIQMPAEKLFKSGGLQHLAPLGNSSNKVQDLKLAGQNTIKNYQFVDVAALFNAGEFKSRPVYSYDFPQRSYYVDFETHTVEMAKKFISEHYIKNVMSGSGDMEEKFLININKDKITKKNIKPVFSLYGEQREIQLKDGMHHLLYNALFQNACISFDVPGQTYREPGTFIGIDRLNGSDIRSTFDTRFFGQWFVIKVTHNFNKSEYSNNIIAVKLHRHVAALTKFKDFE